MEAATEAAIMSTFTLLGDVHTARTGARLPACSLLLSLSRPLSGQASCTDRRAVTGPAAAVRAPRHGAQGGYRGQGTGTGEHVIF